MRSWYFSAHVRAGPIDSILVRGQYAVFAVVVFLLHSGVSYQHICSLNSGEQPDEITRVIYAWCTVLMRLDVQPLCTHLLLLLTPKSLNLAQMASFAIPVHCCALLVSMPLRVTL